MPIVGNCTTCKTPSAISLGHSLLNLLSDFRTPNNFDRHFHTRKSKKQIDRIETIVCLKTMQDVRLQLTTINCAMRCDDTNFGWPNQKNELGVPTHWSEEADLRVKIWSRFIAFFTDEIFITNKADCLRYRKKLLALAILYQKAKIFLSKMV